MSVQDRCAREIERLHDFFTNWFNGELEQTDEQFRQFDSVIADGFVLIDIHAARIARDELAESIWKHWGHPADEGKTMAIETDEVRVLHSADDLHLATYVERQRAGDESNARRSTVLFRESASAPNGLEWLFVQETPLDE